MPTPEELNDLKSYTSAVMFFMDAWRELLVRKSDARFFHPALALLRDVLAHQAPPRLADDTHRQLLAAAGDMIAHLERAIAQGRYDPADGQDTLESLQIVSAAMRRIEDLLADEI